MLMKEWILIKNTRPEGLDQYVLPFKGDLQFITARQDHIFMGPIWQKVKEFFTKKTTKFSQPLKLSFFFSEPYNGKSGLHGGDGLQIFCSNSWRYYISEHSLALWYSLRPGNFSINSTCKDCSSFGGGCKEELESPASPAQSVSKNWLRTLSVT